MVDYIIDICKEKGMEVLTAQVMADNHPGQNLLKKMGFHVERMAGGVYHARLELSFEDMREGNYARLFPLRVAPGYFTPWPGGAPDILSD